MSVFCREPDAADPLITEAYSTILKFDEDKEIYHNATGESPVFTLSTDGNVNGKAITLRLKKPTAVTFPSNFEASNTSTPLDSSKLNSYTLVYFSNWNGSGTPRVVYINILFTAP